MAAPVGPAVLRFEQGEMRFALHHRMGGFIWRHERKPFGRPPAKTAAAVQFL